MVTVKDLKNLVKEWPLEQLPVYVQSGYNRFKINSYVMDEGGFIKLILDEDAYNQPKEVE